MKQPLVQRVVLGAVCCGLLVLSVLTLFDLAVDPRPEHWMLLAQSSLIVIAAYPTIRHGRLMWRVPVIAWLVLLIGDTLLGW